MIMTTDNYFAIEDGTLDHDFDRAIDFKSIKKNMGEMELGESADRVARRHTEFVAFSDETQIISDGRGVRFNENYAGYYYDENDSLYIQSDRGHSVKMEHFSMDSSVSVIFDGSNEEMRFKLGYHHRQNQFTYEEGVQYVGSTAYDRIVSRSSYDSTYYFRDFYEVEELNLTESTAAANTVDTRGGLNGKVVKTGTTGSTDVIWDKYSGDTNFIAQGRDSLNLGSTTLDEISGISFGVNNKLSITTTNQKTITVEGNQLENIVFGGANIGVDYSTQSFYVKE